MNRLRELALQAINGVVPLSPDELAEERMKVCAECEFLARMTNQCRLCWCFMDLKTKILDASCPTNKW